VGVQEGRGRGVQGCCSWLIEQRQQQQQQQPYLQPKLPQQPLHSSHCCGRRNSYSCSSTVVLGCNLYRVEGACKLCWQRQPVNVGTALCSASLT
jgi:hypothetical protein